MPITNVLTVISKDKASFTQDVTGHIESVLSDLTYADFDIEAYFAHYYECDELAIKLNMVDLDVNNLSIISVDGDDIKLSLNMRFSIDAAADFSLSKEDVSLAGTSEIETLEFNSNVEVNITYYQEEQQYEINEIVIEELPKTINFGELEPDYS